MSKTLSSVAVTEFDSLVKQAYQGMGGLKNMVTLRRNVVGDTYKFRKLGKGLANQKSTADDVTPMDVSHSTASATLANWNAPEYTDIFDQAEVNFDEKAELAGCVAGAIGRREDQIIIDAMDAATPLTTAVAAAAANLTVAKLIDAKVELKAQGVGNSDLCGVIEAQGLGGLLNDEKASSGDYQSIRALVNGDINTLLGFKIYVVEDRDEGGLTEASNIVDSWFFHKDAIGMAIGIDMKTEINYIAQKTAWLCNGIFKGGAVNRDAGGLVKVQYDKTA